MGKLKALKKIVDKAKKKSKIKKHGKVSQEQKDIAVTTGVTTAGGLAFAKIQSDRNKANQSGVGQKPPAAISPKGVGAAKRGFGKALK